jgi:hypothetical protein
MEKQRREEMTSVKKKVLLKDDLRSTTKETKA